VDGQCDKLLAVVGQQFMTLTVYIYVQDGGREEPRRAGMSAAAETYLSAQWQPIAVVYGCL